MVVSLSDVSCLFVVAACCWWCCLPPFLPGCLLGEVSQWLPFPELVSSGAWLRGEERMLTSCGNQLNPFRSTTGLRSLFDQKVDSLSERKSRAGNATRLVIWIKGMSPKWKVWWNEVNGKLCKAIIFIRPLVRIK